MSGWFADIFIEFIVRAFFRAIHLVRSRNWPVVTATVLSADCPKIGFGCTVVIVYYEYLINGQKFGDTFEKPFISSKSAEDYAGQLAKGTPFKVRVKPDDATKSVPLRGAAAAA